APRCSHAPGPHPCCCIPIPPKVGAAPRYRNTVGWLHRRAARPAITECPAMMSQEQNDLITRTGPVTPAGKLMRMYWQPAALAEELSGPRPLKAVRLLGEDFVVFRDEAGRYGLMDRDCPHRGADLAFGRLEDGGLRCAFHGWLFDVTG